MGWQQQIILKLNRPGGTLYMNQEILYLVEK